MYKLRLWQLCKFTAIGSQVNLLTDFPDRFIDSLRVIRNIRDILNIVSDDHILHIVIPETTVDEFT